MSDAKVTARAVAWVRAHAALSGLVAGGAVALLVFVLVWFQPQKLFIDQTVDEAAVTLVPAATSAPAAAAETPAPAAPTPAPTPAAPVPAAPMTVASGSFRGLEHPTSGTAILQRLPDGAHVLRLEDFRTSNGPDVRVYLSATTDYDADFVELGKLKGNIGNQNYDVPAGTDVGRFKYAVIWCKRFSAGFGVATLA